MINLGNVYDLTGRYAEAEGSYQYALSLCHKLARDDPYPYQHNVALATAGLANVYRDTQRLADAEKSYLVAVQTYQELVKISPGCI